MDWRTPGTPFVLPEIIGPRLNVYHLLCYFLDPTVTEAYICRLYGLTPEQVAAARAYALTHADTVLERHMQIEDRNAQGNPPEVEEQLNRTRAALQRFRQWLAERLKEEKAEIPEGTSSGLPTFREWLQQHPEEPLDPPGRAINPDLPRPC